MYALERSIEEMTRVIRVLTSEERREVEHSLRCLTHEQILLVREALKATHSEKPKPAEDAGFLVHVFQKWSDHTVTTKLAAIAHVVVLSGARSWPGERAGDRIIGEIITHTGAAAETD